MAIIDNIAVAFQVDGQTAVEYADEEVPANDKVSNKFIEAISDRRFGIKIVVPKTYHMIHDALAFHTYLDGRRVCCPLLFQKNLSGSTAFWSKTVDGSKKLSANGIMKYPWMFAQINEVEAHIPNAPKISPEELQGLGELQVVVSNRRTISKLPQSEKESEGVAFFQARTINEKQIQKGGGMTHTTKLGRPEQLADKTMYKTKQIGDPIATFNFKYRSRRALQSMLLIPRTPSPTPLEEADIDTLNADELRTLLRRQKNRAPDVKPTIKSLKRERFDEGEGIFSARPVKSQKFSNGEVIDLCD